MRVLDCYASQKENTTVVPKRGFYSAMWIQYSVERKTLKAEDTLCLPWNKKNTPIKDPYSAAAVQTSQNQFYSHPCPMLSCSVIVY